MPSQIDSLKETIAQMTALHGKDNPFVRDLQVQLSHHEQSTSETTDPTPGDTFLP